jgi:hypothetical protein
MHLVIKLIVTRATGSIPVDCSISYSVRVKLDCNVTNIRVLQTGFFLLGLATYCSHYRALVMGVYTFFSLYYHPQVKEYQRHHRQDKIVSDLMTNSSL